MNTLSRLFLIACLLVTATLTGCVATTPFKKADPLKSKVLVYVFRPDSLMSRGTIIAVNINGEKNGLIVNNSYLPINANPGTIEIALHTNDFVKNRYDAMILKETKAGEEYFIKAEPGVFGAFKLIKLEQSNGLAEISNAQYYQTR